MASRPIHLMIVVAHPADSFDQAGGTLCHHLEQGDRVTALIVTTGSRSHDWESIEEKRRREGDRDYEARVDASREKHLPVVTKVEGGYKVAVGSVPHPMEPKHYIMWIELLAGGQAYRQFLKPGEKPEAFFPIQAEKVSARELCNIHGMWKA